MKVIVDENPRWLSEIPKTILEEDDFKSIYLFYVLQTPCSDLSSRSKTITSQGWTKPWRKPFYLNRQLKQEATNYNLLFSAAQYDALYDVLRKSDLLQFPPENIVDERVSFYDNKKNQFMSTFYHLRNGLAHGRFNIIQLENDWIFVLEDVAPHKDHMKRVSSRMIIKKSTLLRWMELIRNGEKEYTKNNSRQQ